MAPRTKILDWNWRRPTEIVATAKMPSGVVVPRITARRKGIGWLVLPPEPAPFVGHDGRPMRESNGALRYTPRFAFLCEAARRRFNVQVLHALREAGGLPL